MDQENINTIGKKFTMWELIKFVSVPIITRLFISLLTTLDDGLFISRYCGENALAAFSIIMPWFFITDGLGMLVGGVTSVCSIKMGEKKNEEAFSIFTTIVIASFVLGLFLLLFVTFFLDELLTFLGATDIIMHYAKDYLSVAKIYIPLTLTHYIFSRFYTVAGKPKMGVVVTITQTCLNFFFDWLFMVKMRIGIAGTAYANLISSIVIFIISLVFFSNKKHEMHFAKPCKNFMPIIIEVFKYGRPDFVTSMALSVNSFIANHVLLSIGGEQVVAAYQIVNNIQFMLMGTFFGLFGATCPIASYAYGEKNAEKLPRIIKQTFALMIGVITLDVILILLFKKPLVSLYLINNSNSSLVDMVNYGLTISPLCFPLFGMNVFVQIFSTAIGNHKSSVILSSLENILFANVCILFIPRVFGVNGVWFSFLTSESFTFIFTLIFIIKNQDVYGYGPSGIATFAQGYTTKVASDETV